MFIQYDETLYLNRRLPRILQLFQMLFEYSVKGFKAENPDVPPRHFRLPNDTV